ncbi:zinc finger SWIM domain protein [Methanococcus vannielii SB]|uniref:Zinc finger SWIM domain protein n=1 Tax=Methanococcus vannielii (strain ATCC 35089 / DSM 1224 / JCM 13029 / OCM 148 / SB) TaxID=406327 RepID=A6URU3_METVS|nr:SWIM zinc finger family protein [Methanococcus vannielii]ABR55215.1 zinc finger SWIM domain protein [Methanococcus vannielii SB]
MNVEIYDEMIRERGREYFLKNMVEYCIKRNNILYGKVYGGEPYFITINLNDMTGICTCPYQYNCKHSYALLEAYKCNKFEDGDFLFSKLKDMDKNEILTLFEEIIIKHKLWDEFIAREKNLLDTAKNMLVLTTIEKKNIFTFISFLRNHFLRNSKNEELILLIPEAIKTIPDSKKLEEILFLIVEEIFKRGKIDKNILKELVLLSKKYRELWMVKDSIIEYEYFELLEY